MSIYTKMQVIQGPGIFVDSGPPSFLLRYGKKEWLTEWHPWAGPTVLCKSTQDPSAKQPKEKSPFWLVAQLWYDQGARVENGAGIYEIPPVTGRPGTQQYHKGYKDYPLLTS